MAGKNNRLEKRVTYVDAKGKSKHSSSIKRKDAFYLHFDTTKWLNQFDKKVEDFKGKGGAFERAVARIIPMIEADFRTFMQQHNFTGVTIDSLMAKPNLYWGDESWYKSVGFGANRKTKVAKTENVLFVEYGFQISKGGLAAIFLDIGRPGIKYKNGNTSKEQKPHFFVHYAVERHMEKFQEIFKEEVLKELGGLT